jgi:hypothetical protein
MYYRMKKTILLCGVATASAIAIAAYPAPTMAEANLAAFTGLAQVCAEVYPRQPLGVRAHVQRMVKEAYGEGTQAQQKYQALLARADVQGMMQAMAQENRARKNDTTFGWEEACQPTDKSKIAVLQPRSEAQVTPNTVVPVAAPLAVKPVTAQTAPSATKATHPTPLNCLSFTSNGQGPGSSRFIAHNGATLASLGNIGSITGRIWGATSSDGNLRTINLTANSAWQGQGYQSSGPTGGWHTLLVGTAPNYVDAIDLRFGTKDGIHPGKARVPQGTDSLYVVQRNTKNAEVRMNIQGFDLTVCGAAK